MRDGLLVGSILSNSIVLLDAGPLGLVTYPSKKKRYNDCRLWLEHLVDVGVNVRIPEISAYEVRRGYLRTKNSLAVQRLDELYNALPCIPISTETMTRAVHLWALMRQQGFPAAGDESLDADMTLAAQAQLLADQGHPVIVATTNVKHLDKVVNAEEWNKIAAPQ